MAWLIWLFNGIGIIASFIGTTLVFYGGPKAIAGMGNLRIGSEQQLRASDDPEVQKEIRHLDRKRAMLKWGIAIIGIGFLLQAIGWLLGTPA